MTTYIARATRENRWWLVDVEGIGVTQARNLAEADAMARDLIALVRNVDASSVDVTLVPVLPAALRREVQQARKETTDAQRHQERAASKLRAVAERLRKDAGLTGADVGVVLGVSAQRVSQLAPARPPKSGQIVQSRTRSGRQVATKAAASKASRPSSATTRG